MAETETDPTQEPTPDLQAGPTAEEQLAQAREDKARIEGEAATLRAEIERLQTRPADPPPDPELTLDEIDRRYQAGKYTETERTELRTAIIARDSARRITQQDREAERQRQAAEDLNRRWQDLFDQHPDLQNQSSALVGTARARMAELVRRGRSPDDRWAQLEAAEWATERQRAGNPHDYNRRRQPTGGGGNFNTDEPPKKPQTKGQRLWESLDEESRRYYLAAAGGKQEKAIRTLEFADEALLRRHGRLRS